MKNVKKHFGKAVFMALLFGIVLGKMLFPDAAQAGVLEDLLDFLNLKGDRNASSTLKEKTLPLSTSSLVSPPITLPFLKKESASALSKPVVAYEDAVIAAVETAAPSVVSIVVSKDLPIIEQCPYNPLGNIPPEFRQFFGDTNGFEFSQPCEKGTERREVGGGSGFVVSGDGLVLTNKHVVSDSKASYTVLTNDGKKHDATVLARDPVQDLAVLKIKAGGFTPAKLGDSDTVKLGQTAIVIGNALGEFRNTVSVGVVSGLARSITASGAGTIEKIEGVLQTDAAINQGNSGGPLLNLRGEVIGINTAIVSGAQNIGFAIPINQAKRDIESVKRTGNIKTSYLGVRYLLITAEIAKQQTCPLPMGRLFAAPTMVRRSCRILLRKKPISTLKILSPK